jgi:hypothetical protein
MEPLLCSVPYAFALFSSCEKVAGYTVGMMKRRQEKARDW